MPSVKKMAASVIDNLPLEPSKGNVVDSVHNILKLPANKCYDVVMYLIETGQVDFKGSRRRPTALYARRAS